MDISLPHRHEPRPYQLPFWKYMTSGPKGARGKRASMVWHRRSGKDRTAWNFTIVQSQIRVGTYYYFLPTYRQAKRTIWDSRDDETTFRDHIPPELILKENESELQIELVNGSVIQLIGADSFMDTGVGSNPVGVVLSEYSLISPKAYEFVRPILAENDGWAVFIFTPRGKNHAHKLHETAVKLQEKNGSWFAQSLTIDQTRLADGSYAVSPERVQKDRDEGMPEELIQQEYYVSFSGSTEGSYFTRQLDLAFQDGRIDLFPYDPARLVHTGWDLGRNDANAIWFFQSFPGGPRFIDYETGKDKSLVDWIKICREKRYLYGTHLAPHDIEVSSYETGQTRSEFAAGLGWHFTVVPKIGDKKDSIDAARRLLARAAFDSNKCEPGLNALASYHKEWDELKMTYKDKPVHDWSSNGSDAFQQVALGIDLVVDEDDGQAQQQYADADFTGYEDEDFST
jgi:phage terminase large subunit